MRAAYLGAIALTIALGLASRRFPVLGAMPGDVLYATMAYWGFRFLAPGRPRKQAAIAALAFCFAIECSQLWHAPWLDAARAHPLGALVLGRGFLWEDLGAYMAGVVLGWGIDIGASRDRERRASGTCE
jgi:hypothetical protein